jgi:hypothetical protein
VKAGYNDVRIPGNEGTLFSLTDDLSSGSDIYFRLRVSYTINMRHTFSGLYAPLTVKSDGKTGNTIDFAGVSFPANADLSASYTFNSYRLTYRYDIIKKPKLEFGLGLTGKIRDAAIELKSSGLEGEKTNTGFVPLINFRLLWRYSDMLGLLIEGDALAAKQGRAEDILIAGTWRISENRNAHLGYRILEGGADNDEVYNFSLFHYASIGVSVSFW